MAGGNQSRQILAAINALTEKFDNVDDNVNQIKEYLKDLVPKSGLPGITRPVRGTDFNRTANVAEFLRTRIKEHNDTSTSLKYVEFDEGLTDKQLNTAAKKIIGGLLREKLGAGYGRMTWEQGQNEHPTRTEKVVNEGKKMNDLRVFAQAEGQWAIRMLASEKMKSKLRSSKADVDEDQIGEEPTATQNLNQRTTSEIQPGNNGGQAQLHPNVARRSQSEINRGNASPGQRTGQTRVRDRGALFLPRNVRARTNP